MLCLQILENTEKQQKEKKKKTETDDVTLEVSALTVNLCHF